MWRKYNEWQPKINGYYHVFGYWNGADTTPFIKTIYWDNDENETNETDNCVVWIFDHHHESFQPPLI